MEYIPDNSYQKSSISIHLVTSFTSRYIFRAERSLADSWYGSSLTQEPHCVDEELEQKMFI